MSDKKPLIILAAGGTGGHVFPAESLAEQLLARGYRLALFTDKRGAKYSGVLGQLETRHISAGSVAGRGLFGKIRSVLSLGLGIFQAKRLLAKMEPGVVVGFGGYPSVPTMIAASLGGYATVIHEQNAVLGRANRLLAGKVKRICTSFATVDHIGSENEGKVIFTGNPVRQAILDKRQTPYADMAETINILVLGGSQGAQVFSDILPDAFSKLDKKIKSRLSVTQQCRPEFLDATKESYSTTGIDHIKLDSFFQDVPALLSSAHLLIARAGASTCAEVTTVGRPSILVPYPHATDDHQTRNAQNLETSGACKLIAQTELSADRLTQELNNLFSDPQILTQMADAAYNAGQPDAATRLADTVEDLIKVKE
ncbi:UDP-N-acetylglucosamine--N-acetylmuramyl-(pentapeptide) pyrophosphoryl-undecaprenol N-acetylglucosamine transferase [Terasakiella brassicae]|uniref:UDP-N-acetylglucosamine--N-acetylmuramyl-(pentapeptide) pyrophosphoryl-undecaprenol N-acetylglucosamine transferase n=1 Tax=Terasakiella brassicae TaxID=1634917 RepID=A0A917BYW5_9PROT|nr:undecaprenyldiphospho-muramoylpentapeptide beta-N-acetylglucosaminyltransferase [Terasakiella brassicae]GGF61875.1 UDP-N-acetylglucosamine--N-acetylmuramyl-(pentapeptide) pyrophosphoryl-undecaprenol N-acetylglucosamine transferase [Terasakiella brassicae]